MIQIELDALQPDTIAQTDYFGEKGEMLIARGTLITRRHLTLLEYRNNHYLYFKLGTSPLGENERQAAVHQQDLLKTPDFPGKDKGHDGLVELAKSELARVFDDNLEEQILVDRPSGTALRNILTQKELSNRTVEYKRSVSSSYEAALKETEEIMNRLAFRRTADANDVEYIVKQFFKVFVTDRNILLSIAGIKSTTGEYLYNHSLNVCLLSLNVAASYGYSEEQVLEIGMGALLHDVGMLLVPREIREKPDRFSREEWYEIQKHPILGLHILERLRSMPERIAYVAYQVHERENGTGYPKQRQGRTIHRYAKMVQVADIYEAMTAPRSHRPSIIPYEGMNKIVQMSKVGLLSVDTVRAFLEYVSIFPVGSLVELSDSRIARVVHANREALVRPVVTILTDERGERLPSDHIEQINLALRRDPQIKRPLPLDFIEDLSVMDGF